MYVGGRFELILANITSLDISLEPWPGVSPRALREMLLSTRGGGALPLLRRACGSASTPRPTQKVEKIRGDRGEGRWATSRGNKRGDRGIGGGNGQ